MLLGHNIAMVYGTVSSFDAMSAKNTNTIDASSRGGNNRWAPLSYPSASIFASSLPSRDGGSDEAKSTLLPTARVGNPLFPLHRDVLFATMRELLIIDGKIDHRSMQIISPVELESKAVDTMNLDACSNEHHTTALSSDDDEGKVDTFSSLKKRRIQDTSIDSLPILHEQKVVVLDQSQNQHQPHVVPITEHFDYTRFRNAEALVNCAVDRAYTHHTSAERPSDEHDTSHVTGASIQTTEKPSTVGSCHITSKRKVSDAEDNMGHDHDDSNLDFPSEIVSLVRSNIMLLHTSPSGTALTKLMTTSYSSIEFLPFNATNCSEETDRAILSFLRHPKSQRDQQRGNTGQTRLVLPQLLEVSIDDECKLRAKAFRMVSSMVNTFPGNDMNTSLRAFLGYKSSKSPTRDRIVEMISDLLFDVSHAMYAWIHTHETLLRSKGTDDIADDVKNCSSMDMQIKSSLFDERALKRIGGFEPESLLPLALGIRRCRLSNISWEQFAISNEGRNAMRVHSNQQVEVLGELNDGDELHTSRRRKRQPIGSSMISNSLLELGKKRRGRRGKSIQSNRL